MWPWEHLAFGYLLYSLFRRISPSGPPSAAETAVVVVATQLPDLIDKPLGWVFHLVPTGRSVGHSLMVAGPLSLAVLGACLLSGRRGIGVAFVVGYHSHLLGDVLYDLLTERTLAAGFLLWPVVEASYDEPVDAVPYFLELVGDFLTFLATPPGRLFVIFEVTLVVVALLAWMSDGAPGLAPVARRLGRRSKDT